MIGFNMPFIVWQRNCNLITKPAHMLDRLLSIYFTAPICSALSATQMWS